MPVEIWARFMRTAHQGVTVAALPGQSGSGPSLASIVQQALHAHAARQCRSRQRARSRRERSSRAAVSTDG